MGIYGALCEPAHKCSEWSNQGHFPTERYQLHKARFDSDPIFIESPLWVQQLPAELGASDQQRLQDYYIFMN